MCQLRVTVNKDKRSIVVNRTVTVRGRREPVLSISPDDASENRTAPTRRLHWKHGRGKFNRRRLLTQLAKFYMGNDGVCCLVDTDCGSRRQHIDNTGDIIEMSVDLNFSSRPDDIIYATASTYIGPTTAITVAHV